MARFNKETLNGAIEYYNGEIERLSDRPYYYRRAMVRDILESIREVLDGEDRIVAADNKLDLIEAMDELLWTEDMVTGNGSGRYTMSNDDARKYVSDNLDLMVEMANEFDCKDALLEHLMQSDFEWIDVSIRCYILNGMIWDAVEYLEKLGAIEYSSADDE